MLYVNVLTKGMNEECFRGLQQRTAATEI